MMERKSKAVFLDRDGTISIEIGYIDNVELLEMYQDSVAALIELRQMGYKLVVVSNQSGVAQGFFPESRVQEVNDRMVSLLKEQGVLIDGIYYCPHLPNGVIPEYAIECNCRKPAPGMIKRAEQELNIDLQHSILIGDKLSDIICGRNAGLKTILVRTGYGAETELQLQKQQMEMKPDAIVDTLYKAVQWIQNEAN
jgi:D,D-heptose 1,7-bisphosphate phosphatase